MYTCTQLLSVQQSPGLVFVFHLVQRQRISAGHAHLQVGINLPRSEPAVKTSGLGLQTLVVVYMHRIVPTMTLFTFCFSSWCSAREAQAANVHLKMGTNVPSNSKFGQNKEFGQQPPMVADAYIHTYTPQQRSETSMFTFVFQVLQRQTSSGNAH